MIQKIEYWGTINAQVPWNPAVIDVTAGKLFRDDDTRVICIKSISRMKMMLIMGDDPRLGDYNCVVVGLDQAVMLRRHLADAIDAIKHADSADQADTVFDELPPGPPPPDTSRNPNVSTHSGRGLEVSRGNKIFMIVLVLAALFFALFALKKIIYGAG